MSGKQSVSQLAKMLEQYWAGRSGATAGGVAGNSVTDHHQLTGLRRDDHPQYLNNIRGDARYSLKSDPSVQEHDVIGTFHSVDGSQYDIVGLTATDTLGLLTPGSDISGGNKILISDGSGNAAVGALTASSVATPAITSAADLTLTTTGDILTENTVGSEDWFSGIPGTGAGINFNTGVADFRTITADELIVEAFIAAVKRAHVGALIVTKSMSLTTQAFTIPAAGSTSTLYIADIPGFGGMEAFESGDDVAIPYVGTEEAYTPSHVTTSWGTDDGAGGATVHYGEEDFEGFSIGGDPTDWYDTGTGNGMTLSDLCDVQSVGGSQAFGTTNSGLNFHTHWNGTGYATLDDYRYTGRFRIGDSSNGIGFTVLSQYASGGTDEYYRIRRYSGGTSFHVFNHGDYESSMTGDTDSGYNPSADTWHKFKIEVEDTGTQTELRAKFWADGASEPSTWQIDCYDDSTDRGTAGTFGLWLHSDADGAYVDDIKVESLTGTSTSVTVPIDVETDDVVIAAVHAPTASTFTPAASWTLITSQAYGTDTVRWYRFTATSDGELNSTWGINTGVLQVHLVATRYINTADIVEASSAGSFSSVSSFAVPSLTVAGTDSALLILAMNDQYSGVTAPDGMLIRGLQPTTADSRSAVMSAVVEDSGSTGIKTVGYGGATSGAYLVIALNKKTGTRTDGLVVGTAWGTVEPDTVSSVEADEQAWLFTTATDSPGAGIVVQPDSVVLDYGTVGDGYVEITTLDPSGSPYMQIATRGANPRTQQTVQLRAGNLDGISGAAGRWGLYVGGTTGRLELSDETFELQEIPIRMFSDELETTRLTANGTLYLGTDVSDGATRSLVFSPTSGNLRIGGEDSGDNRIYWNAGSGTLSVTGQIEVESGSSGYDNLADGTTYGKIRNTIIGGGYIQIGSTGQTVDVDLDGWHFGASEIVGQLNGADQIVLNTSGQIVAGGGDVWLDDDGLSLMSGSGVHNAVIWMDELSTSSVFASVEASNNVSGGGYLYIGIEDLNAPHLRMAFDDGVTSSVVLDGQIDDGFTVHADILPGSDSTYDLGSTGTRWANLYVDYATIGANANIGGDLLVTGDIRSYTSLSYSTNWSTYGGVYPTAGYSKFGNVVALRGLIKCSAAWSSGDTCVTLPSGYRPVGNCIFYGAHTDGGVRLDIQTDGRIKVQKSGTADEWVSLEGISFAV